MKGITIALFFAVSQVPGVLPYRPRTVIVEAATIKVR